MERARREPLTRAKKGDDGSIRNRSYALGRTNCRSDTILSRRYISLLSLLAYPVQKAKKRPCRALACAGMQNDDYDTYFENSGAALPRRIASLSCDQSN